MNLRARVNATTPVTKARMAAALARTRAHGDESVAPLSRALADTILGRIPPEERAWATRIEARRAQLATEAEATALPTFDAGQGNGGFTMADSQASLGIAAAMMSLPPIWCGFVMRLVRELRPRTCIELGTAFGISTAYQAAALSLGERGTLTTLEGSDAWAARARENLGALGLQDVAVTVGPIQSSLAPVIERLGSVDFAFIDAEHQEQPTVEHFQALAPAMGRGSYVVLDDVDWVEMQRAFTRIARDPLALAAFRLGRLGVVVMAGDGRRAG